nr:putative ribonuclease H-like domain-containing protein [Tanacetum cinerariifolium]
MVYQMDVKNAFLYGTIEEKVYVCQPSGFDDPDYPDKVYKVVKTLYGLHQAPRAWYKTLATYLLENGFHRGQIDQTLFIKKQKGDIMLVQIYVDDIIFGATNKNLCKSFKKLMKDKFQMSSMGELTFFLGLQVKQKEDGIFINQDKYIAEILKKFGLTEGKSAMKRIFRYLKGKPNLGLWYLKDSPFDLVAYSDSDYAGASLDRKSTTGGLNPTIFVSCIKQFWITVVVKQSNDVTRLQALVDKKKVLVTKATIRDVLRFDDAEGVDCLPNEEIFATLASMRYEKPSTKLTFYKAFFSSQWKFLIHTILQSLSAKRTSWNEFSLAMASAVICFATGDLSTHSTKYLSLALTPKVFANMRRVGKGCSKVETPLFEGMLIAREPVNQGNAKAEGDEEEQGTAAEEPVTAADVNDDQSIPSPIPINPPPQQPQDIPSTSHIQSPPPQHQSPPTTQPQGAYFPMSLLQEALDACATLARRVEHLEHNEVAQDLEILKLKSRVKKLERANKVKSVKLRRLRRVRTSQEIESFTDTIMEDVSNQGRMTEESNKDDAEAKEAEIYHIDMDHATKVLSIQEEEPEVHEVVEVVTTAKLITKVVAAVSRTVSVAAVVPAPVTTSTVTLAPVKVAVPATRRRKGVIIRDPEEESTNTLAETKLKDKGKGILVEEPKPMKKKQQVEMDEAFARKLQEELNQEIDWEVAMEHVKQSAKESPYVQRYQVMKKRPVTEAQARRYMMVYLKNTVGYRLDYFKEMSYNDIRLIFEEKFNSNLKFLLKTKEQIDEEESRAIAIINETPAKKAAKRGRLNEEAKDAEELKKHLEIVPDEDDDVFTKATLLARKVPLVDYQIIHIDNKP